MSGFGGEIARESPKIQRSFNGITNAVVATQRAQQALTDATKAATAAEQAHNDVLGDSTSSAEDKIASVDTLTAATRRLQRAVEDHNKASRAEADSYRASATAIANHVTGINRAAAAAENLEERNRRAAESSIAATERAMAAAQRAGSLTNKLSEIGRTAGYALRGSLIAIVPVLIEDALGAVGALAGALGPLAGAATIAGIGVESLKFATQGFGEAMKDIRDTTKFNEDLRKLAPSAQAAATSLREVLPVIDNIQRASQQALFEGLDEQIRNLSTSLGPMVQQATVGVSEAFNNMFKSAGNELMAPGTMSSIQNIINSTINTFKALEPAIAPAVSALTNFLDVGASFGPGLADTINRLAQEFSTFIQSARDDGSLAKWMQRGLEAAETLIGAVKDISLALNSMGDDGAGAIQSLVGMVKVLSGVIRTLNGDIAGIGAAFTGSGDIISSEIQSWLGPLNAAIKGVNMFIRGMNSLTGMNKAEIPLLTNEDLSTDTVEEKLRKRRELAPRNAGGTLSRGGVPVPGPRGAGGLGSPANAAPGHGLPMPYGSGIGSSLNAPDGSSWSDPRTGYGSPFAPPPSKAKGTKGSDHDRRDAIIAGLDPSQYRVDPYAPVPGMPAVNPTGLTGGPMSPFGGSAYGVSASDVFEKEHGVEKNAHDLEEARKARIAMEKDNTATAQDVEEARSKETEAAYQLWKSQQDLVDKQRGTTADLKKGMDDLGAALDPDFGLGKGLAGLAENLIKFVGNIATAPMRAKLQETVDKDPIKGGYGLLGIMGAKNIAAGKSPLLGNPLSPEEQAAYYDNGSGAGGYGSGVGGYAQSLGSAGPGGAYPGDAALLSGVPPGRYSQAPDRDLLKGLSDCSSSIGDLVNIADGQSTGTGGNLTTGNADTWLPQHGFIPGMGGPGDFRVGYNSGHMQATLPGGTPWNYGSDSAAANRGIGGTGADDSAFNQHYYRPMNGAAGGPVGPGAAPSSYAGLPGSSGGGTVPVFVTNMGAGGMGGGGAAAPGGGAAAPGSGGAPAAPGAPSGSQPPGRGTLSSKVGTPPTPGGAAPDISGHTTGPIQNGPGGKWYWTDGWTADGQRPEASPSEVSAWNAAHGAPGSKSPVPLPLGGGNQFSPGEGLPPSNWGTPGGDQAGGTLSRSPGPGTLTAHPGQLSMNPGTLSAGPGALSTRGAAGTGGERYLDSETGLTRDPSSAGYGLGEYAPQAPGTLSAGPGKLSAGPGILGAAPGTLSGAGASNGPGQGPTTIGGLSPGGVPGGGGPGGVGMTPGGSLDTALSIASSGLDMIAPGAGQAAQVGIKEANRAIQYAGQVGAIGVEGLMQTFLPTGGSDLANNSWFSRIAGGLASATPALPNVAGGAAGKQQQDQAKNGAPGPLTPEQVAANQGQNPNGGNGQTNNITVNNNRAQEDGTGRDVAHHLGQSSAAPMGGMGTPR